MKRLLHAYFRHRYAALFYALILTIGAGPLLASLALDRNWLRIFLELSLFAAVFGFAPTRHSRLLRGALAIFLAARLATLLFEHRPLTFATQPPVIALALAAAVGALLFALRAPEVGVEHVYAALDAYLLAGVFWGMLHCEIEHAWPGSYVGNGAPLPTFPLSTAIYFSFVTLATLGYGDIVPQTEVARGVTVVEAIAGQLYLAVLIARLVSSAALGANRGEPCA
ncbi:MAG: two pore domain potassium channel family protein [Deltaproteobacteria bacterium]|nr:two pore domain potassium channel family protein [Deltaproteobacteria bacterium]